MTLWMSPGCNLTGPNEATRSHKSALILTNGKMDVLSIGNNMDKSTSSDGSDTSDHDANPSINNDYSNANTEVRRAMKGEDRLVFWSRLLVKVTKIIVAISLTAATYRQLKKAETNEFLAAVSFCSMRHQ